MKRKGYALNKIKSYETDAKPRQIDWGGEIEPVYSRKMPTTHRVQGVPCIASRRLELFRG